MNNFYSKSWAIRTRKIQGIWEYHIINRTTRGEDQKGSQRAVDDRKIKRRVLLMKIEDLIFVLFKINPYKIKNVWLKSW